MTVSVQKTMEDAIGTAHQYIAMAKYNIDKIFGEGYAAKHPTLIIAFMEVAAQDFDTMMRYKAHEELFARRNP